jgi:simple sugar transport system ATP-binding protein
MAENIALAAQLRGINKQYPQGKKKANNNINLDLYCGEILCIAGENGAGKTTLMKILTGLLKPDTGEIIINDTVGMVHQHFMLFEEYTVAENIVMGKEPLKWGVFFDNEKAEAAAEAILSEHNFAIKPGQTVKSLSLGEMQQVEICRVLARNAQIIILDEPTSILNDFEIDSLFNTLVSLKEKGKSVVLITHKLNEVKKISDRVAVLRSGELVCVRDTADVDEKEIARLMVGELLEKEFARGHGGTGKKEKVLGFEDVVVRRKGQNVPLLDHVSFSVGSGEILGFAGVGGNGLGVIEAVLGGFLHPAEGRVLHRGKDISHLNIRTLRGQGLSYVPSDRLRLGSAREAAIEENIVINRRHEFMNNFFIDKKAVRNFSDKLFLDYNIEGAHAQDRASFLSGGNLQKLILAREINWFNDYIVFSEPTWGLDIASGSFIIAEIEKLREKGAAIILISTNLNEILELSDRIIVMYRGKAAGVFENSGEEIKQAIGNCMHSGAA